MDKNTIHCTEQKRKHLRQLSEKHYGRALRLYQQMECHIEFLQAQLEFIALLEQGLTGQLNFRSQKILMQVLKCLVECRVALEGFVSSLTDSEDKSGLAKEGETITNIIQERLEYVLDQLIKLYTCHSKKSGGKDTSEKLPELKSLQSNLAKVKKKDSPTKAHSSLYHKCDLLVKLLEQVSEFCQANDSAMT